MNLLELQAATALENACRSALSAPDMKNRFRDALQSDDRASLDIAYKALQLVGYEEAKCDTVAEMMKIVRHAVLCVRSGAVR